MPSHYYAIATIAEANSSLCGTNYVILFDLLCSNKTLLSFGNLFSFLLRLSFSTDVGHHLAAGGCPRVEFLGKILSFFPIFWVFWQRFEFFPLCSLNKSCPNFEFWAKNGLEFFQIGQKLSFFAVEFSRKCWKKACSNGSAFILHKLWKGNQ